MWLLEDIKNRVDHIKYPKSICASIIYIVVVLFMQLIGINSFIVINYEFFFLFLIIIQPVFNNDINMYVIIKIYYPKTWLLHIYLEYIILCSPIFFLALLLGQNILMVTIDTFIYALVFMVLSFLKLNGYTNGILILIIVEVFSKYKL